MKLSIEIENGKYTVEQHDSGQVIVKRYGEFWLRDEPSATMPMKFILCMAQEIDRLRSTIMLLENKHRNKNDA